MGIAFGMLLHFILHGCHQISFSRCFPHVINIAVKAGLKRITTLPDDSEEVAAYDDMFYRDVPFQLSDLDTADASENNMLTWDREYQAALDSNVIGKIRRTTNAICISGQRREQFHDTRVAGNLAGGWGDNGKMMRDVGPINDVETRWDSTFKMTDRFIEIYPVRLGSFPID